jgi:predicted HAD superfamily Cof-like phosphohydrolase
MLELNLVKIFHQKYNIQIVDDPAQVPIERIHLRLTLLHEEVKELVEADASGIVEDIAKEAGDVVYVLLGTALELGYHPHFTDKKLFEDSTTERRSVGCNHTQRNSVPLHNLIKMSEQFKTDWSKENAEKLLAFIGEYLDYMGLKVHFPQIIQEVHRSNMSKGTDGKPIIRTDGKIMKGEDFTPADLSFLTKDILPM